MVRLHERVKVAQPVSAASDGDTRTQRGCAIFKGIVPLDANAIAHARIPEKVRVPRRADIVLVVLTQTPRPSDSTADFAFGKHKGDKIEETRGDEVLDVAGNNDLASKRDCLGAHDADTLHLGRLAPGDGDDVTGTDPSWEILGEEGEDGMFEGEGEACCLDES